MVNIQESIVQKKVTRKWIRMVEDQLEKQRKTGFAASKDGQVVGFMLGEIKEGIFGLDQSGWIELVGVQPRLMGSGIGQALAERLSGYFKKKGIKDIYTAVRWDAVDMLSFFKSIGFDRSNFINLRKRLD